MTLSIPFKASPVAQSVFICTGDGALRSDQNLAVVDLSYLRGRTRMWILPSSATISANDVNDGSSVPDGDSIILALDSTAPLGVGIHIVTMTITDTHDASSSCTATVTMIDRTPPAINACASDKTLSASSNCQAAIPNLVNEVSATDTCTPASALIINQSPAAGTLVGVGTTTVTITVTDAAGNVANCTARVTVVDTIPPSITAPANASYQCLTQAPAARASDATATDSCGAATLMVSETDNAGTGSIANPLVITRRFTAVDSAGNSASAVQTITVEDDTPPAITGLSANPSMLWPPNHELVAVAVNYDVTDNCDPASGIICALSVTCNEGTNSDWKIIDSHHLSLRAERSGGSGGRIYTITVICTDSKGNSSSRTVTVTVPHNQ